MSEYNFSDVPFKEWTASQLADYLKTKELGDYSEMFINQGITGKVAHRLSDAALKEMGIDKIGDRLAIMEALETLKKAQQQQDREKVLWQGEELLYLSCFDGCWSTCCGCCPQDPDQYKLTTAYLEIKKIKTCRVLCVPCCCGHSYEIDTVDLSRVVDCDIEGIPPTCVHQTCCAATQEQIHVKTHDGGEKVLKLKQGDGQTVARKIKNQVEIMQRMERS